MSIEILPEVENRLADEARKLGISVDAPLKRLIGRTSGGLEPRPSRP
jgi:hypothetical protein